jgi:hypothetical protein
MLSDQGSPYVGRFARGWRRLPGEIPGQPQTRTRARSSISSSPRAQERPGPDDEHHLRRAGIEQRLGARRGRGARCEHIVNEQHVRGHRGPIASYERAAHGRSTVGGISLGLRAGRSHTPQERPDRQTGVPRHLNRQHLRLVESSLGFPAAGERNPGHHVGAARGRRGHRSAERSPDTSHPAIFEVVDRLPGRPLESERRPRTSDDVGWAVTTAPHARAGRWGATAVAPWGRQRDEVASAPVAEGPGARATARAPRGEDHVERALQHRPTISALCDMMGSSLGKLDLQRTIGPAGRDGKL